MHKVDQKDGVGAAQTHSPSWSPVMIRRRLSNPEIIMRKHALSEQRSRSTSNSDSTDSIPQLTKKCELPKLSRYQNLICYDRTVGSESDLSRNHTGFSRPSRDSPVLMLRKSALLRRFWNNKLERNSSLDICTKSNPQLNRWSPKRRSVVKNLENHLEPLKGRRTVQTQKLTSSKSSMSSGRSFDDHFTDHSSWIENQSLCSTLTSEYPKSKESVSRQTSELSSSSVQERIVLKNGSDPNANLQSTPTIEDIAKRNDQPCLDVNKNPSNPPEPSPLCQLNVVSTGSIYRHRNEISDLLVPRISALPRTSSMEVMISSGEHTGADSDTTSLVDSLEDAQSPKRNAQSPVSTGTSPKRGNSPRRVRYSKDLSKELLVKSVTSQLNQFHVKKEDGLGEGPGTSKYDLRPVRGEIKPPTPPNVKEPSPERKGSAYYLRLNDNTISTEDLKVTESIPQRLVEKIHKRQERIQKRKEQRRKREDTSYTRDHCGNVCLVERNGNKGKVKVKEKMKEMEFKSQKKVKRFDGVRTIEAIDSYQIDSKGNVRLIPKNKTKKNSQSNQQQVQPLPRRIYQRTEYNTHGRKIEILEIVEGPAEGMIGPVYAVESQDENRKGQSHAKEEHFKPTGPKDLPTEFMKESTNNPSIDPVKEPMESTNDNLPQSKIPKLIEKNLEKPVHITKALNNDGNPTNPQIDRLIASILIGNLQSSMSKSINPVVNHVEVQDLPRSPKPPKSPSPKSPKRRPNFPGNRSKVFDAIPEERSASLESSADEIPPQPEKNFANNLNNLTNKLTDLSMTKDDRNCNPVVLIIQNDLNPKSGFLRNVDQNRIRGIDVDTQTEASNGKSLTVRKRENDVVEPFQECSCKSTVMDQNQMVQLLSETLDSDGETHSIKTMDPNCNRPPMDDENRNYFKSTNEETMEKVVCYSHQRQTTSGNHRQNVETRARFLMQKSTFRRGQDRNSNPTDVEHTFNFKEIVSRFEVDPIGPGNRKSPGVDEIDDVDGGSVEASTLPASNISTKENIVRFAAGRYRRNVESGSSSKNLKVMEYRNMATSPFERKERGVENTTVHVPEIVGTEMVSHRNFNEDSSASGVHAGNHNYSRDHCHKHEVNYKGRKALQTPPDDDDKGWESFYLLRKVQSPEDAGYSINIRQNGKGQETGVSIKDRRRKRHGLLEDTLNLNFIRREKDRSEDRVNIRVQRGRDQELKDRRVNVRVNDGRQSNMNLMVKDGNNDLRLTFNKGTAKNNVQDPRNGIQVQLKDDEETLNLRMMEAGEKGLGKDKESLKLRMIQDGRARDVNVKVGTKDQQDILVRMKKSETSRQHRIHVRGNKEITMSTKVRSASTESSLTDTEDERPRIQVSMPKRAQLKRIEPVLHVEKLPSWSVTANPPKTTEVRLKVLPKQLEQSSCSCDMCPGKKLQRFDTCYCGVFRNQRHSRTTTTPTPPDTQRTSIESSELQTESSRRLPNVYGWPKTSSVKYIIASTVGGERSDTRTNTLHYPTLNRARIRPIRNKKGRWFFQENIKPIYLEDDSLAVLGSMITPRKKPPVQTMTEKDLTRGRNQSRNVTPLPRF